MKTEIYPHQYFALKKQVDDLINVYQSVSDLKTVATMQSLIFERIDQIFPEKFAEIEALKEFILDKTLSKAKAQAYLEDLKAIVIPFETPSNKQVEKVFRKVKKLHVPILDKLDLKEHTYIGWNDPGSQRKYLMLYQDQRLTGIYGSFSPNVLQNVCTICNHVSNVAMFLATTKSGGDGTYTKKGNYICVDSDQCNRQLFELAPLHEFVVKMQESK
ncbi:FusB/FusC family EF-G-binding protein [Enterococcus sp. LJL120]